MGKYKLVMEKFTVDGGLDTTEIESLRDEMQEWVDNMGGTALENTSRYQMAEEAVSQLDRVDEVNFEDIWDAVSRTECLTSLTEDLKNLEYEVGVFKVKSRRRSPSRAYRLSNAISAISGAIECLREFLETHEGDQPHESDKIREVRTAIDEVESTVQEFENVEFPGMYG